MFADPMVGYWCRVGSRALTHTHNDVAILVQRRTLLSIFFFFVIFLPFLSLNVVRVCCRFLVVAECDKFARLSTVEREPVLCAGLDIPCGLHLSTAVSQAFETSEVAQQQFASVLSL